MSRHPDRGWRDDPMSPSSDRLAGLESGGHAGLAHAVSDAATEGDGAKPVRDSSPPEIRTLPLESLVWPGRLSAPDRRALPGLPAPHDERGERHSDEPERERIQ